MVGGAIDRGRGIGARVCGKARADGGAIHPRWVDEQGRSEAIPDGRRVPVQIRGQIEYVGRADNR